MSESAVVARSLTYKVGAATLVANVELEAFFGQMMAVIGPNGAGKSTLLNLLAGNLRPTSGRVLLNGVGTAGALPGELARVRSILRQPAMVDLPFTVGQIVDMGRFPYRRDVDNTSTIDARAVSEALRRTDTGRYVNRIFTTLSSGEQTRVSLARVLAQDTPLVFLDEPTSALDISHQERIMREAVQMARRGKAVVVVLHDLNIAAAHADSIVLMNAGEAVARGTPRQVLRQELLSDVYEAAIEVVDHPFRDCPLVLSLDS